MAQDGQGFLWIGTETGLYRYDGNGVTHFGRAEGVPSDLVNWFWRAGRERLGAVAQGIARQVHEHFEAIHLPAEADALRDSFQSFAVDGHGSVFVPRRAACCGCNRIAGAINVPQRKCCSGGRDRCCGSGGERHDLVCGKKQDWALSAGKIRTRECRGA